MGFRGLGFGGFRGLEAIRWVKAITWTPRVCRIIAFCWFWAILLPGYRFRGLGVYRVFYRSNSELRCVFMGMFLGTLTGF